MLYAKVSKACVYGRIIELLAHFEHAKPTLRRFYERQNGSRSGL